MSVVGIASARIANTVRRTVSQTEFVSASRASGPYTVG